LRHGDESSPVSAGIVFTRIYRTVWKRSGVLESAGAIALAERFSLSELRGGGGVPIRTQRATALAMFRLSQADQPNRWNALGGYEACAADLGG
jgi:hypothetical protein